MPEETRIITQSRTSAISASLQDAAANLNVHVNSSLSKAHGLNAFLGSYSDSNADIYGNVVLTFEFGQEPNITRLYAPAKISTLGPGRVGTGLLPTATTSAGSSTSPGVPIAPRALITDISSESLTDFEIYNQVLLAHTASVHSDTGSSQAHGGETYTNTSVLDTAGHVVGRKYVTIGVNGIAYRIPCDLSPTGPPQFARIVGSGIPVFDVTFVGFHHYGGEILAFNPDYSLNVYAEIGGYGANPPKVQIDTTLLGTPNVTWQWQYSTDGLSWSDLVYTTTFGDSQTILIPTTATGGTSTSTPEMLQLLFSVDGLSGGCNLTRKIRLVVDNTGAGGAIYTSPTINFSSLDAF